MFYEYDFFILYLNLFPHSHRGSFRYLARVLECEVLDEYRFLEYCLICLWSSSWVLLLGGKIDSRLTLDVKFRTSGISTLLFVTAKKSSRPLRSSEVNIFGRSLVCPQVYPFGRFTVMSSSGVERFFLIARIGYRTCLYLIKWLYKIILIYPLDMLWPLFSKSDLKP